MHDLKKAKNPIILRDSQGELARIVAVYAYDPEERTVLCKLRTADGWLRAVSRQLGELEALDANEEYVDTDLVVRRMAREIVKQSPQFAG